MKPLLDDDDIDDIFDDSNRHVVEQLEDLDSWHADCLKEKQRYLDFGSDGFNKALLGTAPGTSIYIAGAPNMGKSQVQTSLVLKLLENNPDVVICDCTLDDNKNKRLQHYAANLAHLPMNQIAYANKITEEKDLVTFTKAVNTLKNYIKDEKLFVYEASRNLQEGGAIAQDSVRFIKAEMLRLRERFPNKKLVLIIDSLNDVVVSKTETDDFKLSKLIVNALDAVLMESKSILIATTHLRKVNGRRPTTDDLKGNSCLAYEAKVIVGIYNDVSMRSQSADIYWATDSDPNRKLPVVEACFVKNKVSDFKGIIPCQQWPAQARVCEAPLEIQQTLLARIYGGESK